MYQLQEIMGNEIVQLACAIIKSYIILHPTSSFFWKNSFYAFHNFHEE